ncbi:MAG: hypothetical protein HRT72_03575, partial [Flavobacteriales bacterium]|nr:hypothetical protein [Flavobacteriales bacterium]
AIYSLNLFINAGSFQKSMFEKLKKAGYISAGICLLVGLGGSLFFDFSGVSDAQLAQQGWPIESLENDRESLLKISAFKSLILIGLSFGIIYFFFKQKISKPMLIGGLLLLFIFDFGVEGKKYLNADNFVKKRDVNKAQKPTTVDLEIWRDKDPNYRVFNVTANPFTDAITSAKHKSIGGYHGAKLLRYQELIERHLSKNNINVINMLNGRYMITPNGKTGIVAASRNPGALGNAWFIDNINWVKNADEEINALTDFNPASTVIIDQQYKEYIAFDVTKNNTILSDISLTDYKANKLTYRANVVGGEALAVFSEIYYEGGDNDWKVFIDGVETSHIRANYVLRALAIPAGEHEIVFEFIPSSYFLGEKISFASSIILALLLLGSIGWEIKLRNQPQKES